MFFSKNKLLFFGGIAIVAAFLIWSFVSAVTSQSLKVIFFDIGQGDAIFIRTPEGQNVLIDGGPGKSVVYKLEKYLPWYDRTIDAMILTHPHADHVSGLIDVLKRYEVKRVISTGVVHTTPEYFEWLNLIKEKKIPAEPFKKGDRLSIDNDINIITLFPEKTLTGERVEDLNNTSLVFLLQTPRAKILLMGDAQEDIEKQILKDNRPLVENADILKAGHHGSRFATSVEFLSAVKPKYAVISAGVKNQFGHPHLETLKRLHETGVKILRTDEAGDVVFIGTKDGSLLRAVP